MKTFNPIQLEEADLEETFVKSSGPGGQNVNKVATKVILKHLPSGLQVIEQSSRSQYSNRMTARSRLAELIEEARHEKEAQQKHKREKLRRQNSERPNKVKKRILESKKKRSKVKQLRKKIRHSDSDN